MMADCGAQLLVRANIFHPGSNLDAVVAADPASCDPSRPPSARLDGNQLNGARAAEPDRFDVFDPATADLPDPEPATASLDDRVTSFAGWQPVGYPDGPTTTSSSTTTTTSSSTTTTTTTTTAISERLDVSLVAKSRDSVTVSWNAIRDATSYAWRLSRCDGTVILSSETTATTKSKGGLAPGCYAAEVRAKVSGSWTGWSRSSQVTIG
jgi:hypothetical protein